MLKVGINIAMVTSKADSLKQQNPEVFEGFGKLKNKQILLVFSVTPSKIDQNKNQNHSTDKVQNLGNERR